ncbi:MAG: hypothetical protein AMXMBFR77_28690 [Phycisphaerales bacterium]|nr:hypothetical protein [Leptolyngbya sp.]MCQ3941223.1 hypothetical protein [cyanobacterium CYA1]MDL1905508.1 hypothetical protein [Synechococcales cyanobacterium CNB]
MAYPHTTNGVEVRQNRGVAVPPQSPREYQRQKDREAEGGGGRDGGAREAAAADPAAAKRGAAREKALSLLLEHGITLNQADTILAHRSPRFVREAVQYERKRASGRAITAQRLFGCLRHDWHGEERRARLFKAVRDNFDSETDARRWVMQYDRDREETIDAIDNMSDAEVHELLQEVIGRESTQERRDQLHARVRDLVEVHGQTVREICLMRSWVPAVVQVLRARRSGLPRYVPSEE